MKGLKLRSWAMRMRLELRVLSYALRDPRVKWYSKALIFLTVAYALSPLDLIPDFIPVLGLLDDLLIVPLGIFVALKTIPRGLVAELRSRAAERTDDRRLRRFGLAIVLLVWMAVLALLIVLLLRWIASR